jgi:hypothetical protein
VLVHVAIEAEAGTASAVAQRLAFVEGLSLREVEGENRLIGTLRVPDSCPLDDVIRLFRADSAVVGVHHLATEEGERGVE